LENIDIHRNLRNLCDVEEIDNESMFIVEKALVDRSRLLPHPPRKKNRKMQ